jgi:hypothetical protein
MDLKTMRENYNKIVKYNHRMDEPIFAKLIGIYFHKPAEKEVCSVMLVDNSGATYRADPRDIEELQ